MRVARREIVLLVFLAAAPLLAFAPAWRANRLLAPGEAAQLHLPLRVEVWRAYHRGESPSWNPSIFSGTPLVASYRPGALHPLMLLLAPLPPLLAFQALVLLSLVFSGPLLYLYARRLGAEPVGALTAGLGFALGPYLVGQLEDTATIVAAPALPLVLLAAETHLARGRAWSALGLAGAIALVALAGSPEAAGAAAILLAARLGIAFVLRPVSASFARQASVRSVTLATGAGLLLSAPQLLPTLLALGQAGSAACAPASTASPIGGVAGLIVSSLSHTPAAVFVLSAVPLLSAAPGLRLSAALACAALLGLAAAGRLEPRGAVPLALDLTLALGAGLSLSAQWKRRGDSRGRRLRLLALIAALFAAAALSVATTVTGPLEQRLSAPLGLLALAFILYFALAEARSPVAAHVFLLPLAASFLMQPWGRESWAGAPLSAELERATPTREAVDRAMGQRRLERTLVLAEARPGARASADLAWANQATFAGRRNANGWDPLVPDSRRSALEGMGSDGVLTRRLLESDPGRLELLGIRWLQVPTETLATTPDAAGVGDALDVLVTDRRPHLFALPITSATEVRIVSFLAGAVQAEQGRVVAECVARLASGREIWLPIRAGIETAEWAWDRPDVRSQVRHAKARVHASFPVREGFSGHQYAAVLGLPGRFYVRALRFRALAAAPPLWLLRAGLHDEVGGRGLGVALASAHASDEVRLAQIAATPDVSLFEVRRGIGEAWVVESLRRLPDERALLDVLRAPTRLGVDPRREALASGADAAGVVLPPGGRSGAAEVARRGAGWIVLRAEGPGLLVVGEGHDPGWSAKVDGAPARIVRVNGDRMAVALGAGHHRVVLRHAARGLREGAAVGLLALLALLAAVVRERRRVSAAGPASLL